MWHSSGRLQASQASQNAIVVMYYYYWCHKPHTTISQCFESCKIFVYNGFFAAHYCRPLWRRMRARHLIVYLSRASFLRHRARLKRHGRGLSPAFGEEILMRSPICPGFCLRCAANRHSLISPSRAFCQWGSGMQYTTCWVPCAECCCRFARLFIILALLFSHSSSCHSLA